MTRLNYALPLAASVALAACTGDDTTPADTDQGSTSAASGTSDPDGGPGGNPTGEPTTNGDSDTMAPDDTSGDPCDGVVCEPGFECVPGTGECFPSSGSTGDICDEWGMGEYADCVDGAACDGNGGICVNAPNEGEGVCTFSCEDFCDCPEAPPGGTAPVACGTVTQGGSGECFLDCSEGQLCPTDMTCFANSLCIHTNTEPIGPYDGCNPGLGFTCPPMVTCLSDNPDDPSVSSCTPECDSLDDCPDGPEGSTVACEPVAKGVDQALCYLTCEGGAECPEGWNCIANFICLQDAPVPPEPTVGYGGCVPNDNCLDGETCYEPDVGGSSGSGSGSSGSGSGSGSDSGGPTPGPNSYNVCTQADCANAGECPDAPGSGDAPVACGDIGSGGDTCYLDCSGGQTCPDQMTCLDDSFCAFDECGVAVDDPSFEEASLADSAWDQASMAFGTPLCDGACAGGMSAARTGEWWIWFGGTNVAETASVSQEVVIADATVSLSMWVWLQAATSVSPELDYMAVFIDGNEEFRITAEDTATYGADYTEVLVDVSAYADGGTHTILLDSSVEGTEGTNIFVDDVTLVCG